MAEPTPTVSRMAAPPVPLVPLGGRGRPVVPLPVPLTSFVGRAREVEGACALLGRRDVRLLTLTGPGGVGKSRLALRVAAELGPGFADGVAFVPLAAVADAGLVVPAIARALGVREAGARPLAATLAATLRERTLLLVLDNFEQVVDAAPLVTDLLGACPRLKALVTSRALLRVSGEHAYPVLPLALPDAAAVPDRLAEAEAVRLFAERAGAADPGFALAPENAAAVAEICRRLDGLPLAIELAAAKAALLPPGALLARLERRLPVLTGDGRDQPARLRTMRDAIAWSHDLLSPAEQALFRRLAVFAGGFTLEAAEAVAGDPDADVFATVEALAGQSLVTGLGVVAGEPRFGLLETVREFGVERLEASGEAEAVRARHAASFMALAEVAEPRLRRAGQDRWLARLDAEHDNLRAALAWGLTADAVMALRLGGTLHWFWYLRGH